MLVQCDLNTLQFAHTEMGQIFKERVAVVETTTYQGISSHNT